MSIRCNTPCDYGECPYDAQYSHDCEYWCGAEEPADDYEEEERNPYEERCGIRFHADHEDYLLVVDAQHAEQAQNMVRRILKAHADEDGLLAYVYCTTLAEDLIRTAFSTWNVVYTLDSETEYLEDIHADTTSDLPLWEEHIQCMSDLMPIYTID